MMETVLNVGLNDESVRGPGRAERRRAVRAWTPTAGCCRCSAPPCSASTARCFSDALDELKERPRHRPTTPTSTSTTCASWSRRTRSSSRSTPAAASRRTRASSWTSRSRAVFDSWNTERAVLYRRQEQIPEDLGTAVNVQAMVFGNRGDDSGSGVALHPRPGVAATRACTATTCRTPRARTSSPASATPCRWPTSARSTRRRTTSCSRSWRRSSSTTATCATSSSPSSAASSGCCRPGSASAPPRRRSGSRCTWSTRA